jgi:polyphenol oxidase
MGNAEPLAEEPRPGAVPRYELADWTQRYGISAGITARDFDLGLWSDAPVGQVMERWRRLRSSLAGADALALGLQVHGAEVRTVGPARGWMLMDGIDGWVTTTPGTFLTVTVADCVPVYLAVPGRGVALLHAGWRGTAAGILTRGLDRLLEATGVSGEDVVMHCGVAICDTCYEVGSEVMSGCGVPAGGPGPWHLDLRALLAEQAAARGVGRVTASPFCSAHHRDCFYSHRASRGSDGRMVAYLGMPRERGVADGLAAD